MYRNSRVSPKLHTRILCLCNSPSAVSVVPVVSVVWRGCLFYASGLCSFWQTVRAFCQSLPGKHSYNKHQHFFPPLLPTPGSGLIPSRAHSLLGSWKLGPSPNKQDFASTPAKGYQGLTGFWFFLKNAMSLTFSERMTSLDFCNNKTRSSSALVL